MYVCICIYFKLDMTTVSTSGNALLVVIFADVREFRTFHYETKLTVRTCSMIVVIKIRCKTKADLIPKEAYRNKSR